MKLSRKVLYRPARAVEFDDCQKNSWLEQDLLAFMRRERALGLAAPQVGISRRVFVMEVGGETRACFNPEINKFLDELVDFDEGCLSFPGESCTIKRHDTIQTRYQDSQGHWHTETMTGLMSRCFQHELDHLDGITMWDRYKEQHAK